MIYFCVCCSSHHHFLLGMVSPLLFTTCISYCSTLINTFSTLFMFLHRWDAAHGYFVRVRWSRRFRPTWRQNRGKNLIFRTFVVLVRITPGSSIFLVQLLIATLTKLLFFALSNLRCRSRVFFVRCLTAPILACVVWRVFTKLTSVCGCVYFCSCLLMNLPVIENAFGLETPVLYVSIFNIL